MESKSLEMKVLEEMLHTKYETFMDSLLNKDRDTLKQIAEPRLVSKSLKAAESLDRSLDIKFEAGKRPIKSYIFDIMINQGVFTDRTKNETNIDFYLFRDLEPEGIRYF